MENTTAQNGTCFRATIDVAHYRRTGEVVYTTPREPYRLDLEPEILDMLQNSDIGAKRLGYLMNREKFLHITQQVRMNDERLAAYFGCQVEVIRAFKKRYASQN